MTKEDLRLKYCKEKEYGSLNPIVINEYVIWLESQLEQQTKDSIEVEELKKRNKKLLFMIENGLGAEDLKNDI